jgi:hypothetical protein
MGSAASTAERPRVAAGFDDNRLALLAATAPEEEKVVALVVAVEARPVEEDEVMERSTRKPTAAIVVMDSACPS